MQYNEDRLEGLLGHYLHRASTTLRNQVNVALADLDVTSKSYVVLTLIEENPAISQAGLAKRLGAGSANLARMLAELEARGIVRREKVEKNSHALSLTLAGQRVVGRCHVLVEEQEGRSKALLTPAGLDCLLENLRKLW